MKSLLFAPALVAGMMFAPGSASAAGPCADLAAAQGAAAYIHCIKDNNAICTRYSMFGVGHATCKYGDGGHDECDYHPSPNGIEGACNYFAAGQ